MISSRGCVFFTPAPGSGASVRGFRLGSAFMLWRMTFLRNSGEDTSVSRICSRPTPLRSSDDHIRQVGPRTLSSPVWIGLKQLFVTFHHVHASLTLGWSLAWWNAPRANSITTRGQFPAILNEHFRRRESPIQREQE